MEQKIAGYRQEEWEKIRDSFARDCANAMKKAGSFRDLIQEILKGETPESFEEKTGLTQNMFDRITGQVEREDLPWRKTLMSICVAYDLDVVMAYRLLDSLGLRFDPVNRRDYAYLLLLTRCRGKSIAECNEILKALGIPQGDWIGHYARKDGGADMAEP